VFSVPNKWVSYEEVERGVFVEVEVGEVYDPKEQDEAVEALTQVIRTVLKDGGRKRAAGTKPPWWKDDSHERALFSHLYKVFGLKETMDKDSGADGLAHLGVRALMLAYQRTHGKVDPKEREGK
jgi:hypothetical protein